MEDLKNQMTQTVMLSSHEEFFKTMRIMIREEVELAIQAQFKEPKYYNKKEAAKKLGVCVSSIYNWMQEGKLKGHKIGKRVVFKESDLENCLLNVNKYGRIQG